MQGSTIRQGWVTDGVIGWALYENSHRWLCTISWTPPFRTRPTVGQGGENQKGGLSERFETFALLYFCFYFR
jgi:hypothetical protein